MPQLSSQYGKAFYTLAASVWVFSLVKLCRPTYSVFLFEYTISLKKDGIPNRTSEIRALSGEPQPGAGLQHQGALQGKGQPTAHCSLDQGGTAALLGVAPTHPGRQRNPPLHGGPGAGRGTVYLRRYQHSRVDQRHSAAGCHRYLPLFVPLSLVFASDPSK